jgi:hypothetical protein
VSSAKLSLATAGANADGSFDPVTLTLPDELESGPHPLAAVGLTSGRRVPRPSGFAQPQPWLVVDSYAIVQYGDLGLVAGGFEPMDQVQVSLAWQLRRVFEATPKLQSAVRQTRTA